MFLYEDKDIFLKNFFQSNISNVTLVTQIYIFKKFVQAKYQ